ncbi:hypothetical protein GYMLUDRAFT_258817 [Collybiopsis luxurians FD-317 M1]|nr:hypothetical protein GYMLUDRAFT_258817 [Collybiopsis luxurians FD-317 M1]
MNVLAFGASKNIGYYTSLRLLDAGYTVIFMLRSPSVFNSDEIIQSHVRSGKAHLLKGDALVQSDVKRAWEAALSHGAVDVLLFSVGGIPSFKLSQGFVLSPPNLVTQCLLNVLCTMPTPVLQASSLKIVTLSSIGLTKSSHDALPVLMKPLYSRMLDNPHKDKLGSERLIRYCAGLGWDVKNNGEPSEEIMGERWREKEGLPKEGTLKNVLIVRPALLTDGECKADRKADRKKGKDGYRVAVEGEIKGYTVSRKDVAHFIADALLHRWDEYANKCVSIAY